MQKEAIIAVIIGSSIGLLVAFGVWRVNKNINTARPNSQSENNAHNSGSQKFEGLSIVSPNSNTVLTASPVLITGLASPSTYIVTVGGDDNTISLVSSSGEFSQEIDLSGGVNYINIWAFDSNGNSTTESLTLVYSSQMLEDKEADQDATAAAQQKLDTANLDAYMGTVTDITGNSVQVKANDGQIVQIAVNPDTASFANIVKTPKEIEYTDIAIGDYVVVIAQTIEPEINAKRILVSTEASDSSTKVLFGEVKTISSKEFIVVSGSDEYSIDATGKVAVTTTKDGQIIDSKLTTTASEGSKLIVVGEIKDEELVAARIHVFPQI